VSIRENTIYMLYYLHVIILDYTKITAFCYVKLIQRDIEKLNWLLVRIGHTSDSHMGRLTSKKTFISNKIEMVKNIE